VTTMFFYFLIQSFIIFYCFRTTMFFSFLLQCSLALCALICDSDFLFVFLFFFLEKWFDVSRSQMISSYNVWMLVFSMLLFSKSTIVLVVLMPMPWKAILMTKLNWSCNQSCKKFNCNCD
jgi:hypothetical protein